LATWSAPGKVFLFGEHAVVYGKPGIALAIRPRVYVTVRKTSHAHHAKSPYIDQCFKELNVKGSVYINSQLPSSSGLGSSAAVTVATLAAINDEFDLGRSRDDIAEIAYRIEKRVQKGRASPTDTTVSSYGGMFLIKEGTRKRLAPQHYHLVIGNSQVTHSTARMVEKVADLKARYPQICEPVLDAIEAITYDAMKHLDEPSYLGKLMDMNHSLLDTLGVGHPHLSRLVLAARATGAYGAKTTGAGGGGCMVALAPKNLKARIAGALEVTEGRALITCLDTEGLRKEKDV
jgi:mevalonate kinase